MTKVSLLSSPASLSLSLPLHPHVYESTKDALETEMFEILTSREVQLGGLLDQARNAYRVEDSICNPDEANCVLLARGSDGM